MRRFVRDPAALFGLGIVGVLVLVALAQPVITPYDPFAQDLYDTLAPPSPAHWFGTDVLGRDLFSGILYGTRLALLVGVATMAASLVVGAALGVVAGFAGGAWDAVLGRVIDVVLAFPLLLGAILVVRAVGDGVGGVLLAFGALGWAAVARLMRAQARALRAAGYVEAARAVGARPVRIVVRHVLPNAIAPVLVYAFGSVGVSVVALASLSYLGIGVPADVPEWGRLIGQAAPYLTVPGTTHLWLAPTAAIVVTTLGFALLADGLRDALDPRS